VPKRPDFFLLAREIEEKGKKGGWVHSVRRRAVFEAAPITSQQSRKKERKNGFPLSSFLFLSCSEMAGWIAESQRDFFQSQSEK